MDLIAQTHALRTELDNGIKDAQALARASEATECAGRHVAAWLLHLREARMAAERFLHELAQPTEGYETL